MKHTLLITNGKVVMPDRIVLTGEVYIKNGVIQYVGRQGEHSGLAAHNHIDAGGGYILPGFVDLHSDAIEKEIEPRPGVYISADLAFRELEKKIAGQGITTMYHSFSLAGAELGVRGNDYGAEIIRTLACTAKNFILVRNKIHLRYEITNIDGVSSAELLIRENLIDLLSFMDHTPGQGQFQTIEDYRIYVEKTYHLPISEIEKILKDKAQGGLRAGECVGILSKAALASGIPMASHDDDNSQIVAYYQEHGVTINEFPVNLDTAVAASQVGNYVCVGAPNILRGGSTGKGLRAIDALKAGAANIICSDYYTPSILQAVFKLMEEGISLYEAVAMASCIPARALGLNTGSLEEGKWGDVIVVQVHKNIPVVMNTVVGGIPVYGVNYRPSEFEIQAVREQLA
ncbi:MAG: alpha-D-ribose 1-methylphosphonate 5-triphosphate diphosphatase [Desulfitobacteriaceae bacterium]